MAEYIERAAAIRMLRGSAVAKYPLSFSSGIFASADELEKLPAADVSQLRHGRWIEPQRLYYGAKQYECSLCWAEEFWDKHGITEKYPCCPNCGAKMEGDHDG